MAEELTEEQKALKKGEKEAIERLLAYYRKEAKSGRNYYIGSTQEKAEALDMLSCISEFLVHFDKYRFENKERFELDENGKPIGIREGWRWRWRFDLSEEVYDKMRGVFLDSMDEITDYINEKGNSVSPFEIQGMQNVASQVMYFVYHYKDLDAMIKNGEFGIGKEQFDYLNRLRAEAEYIKKQNYVKEAARHYEVGPDNSNRTSDSDNETIDQESKSDGESNNKTILKQEEQEEQEKLSPRKKGEIEGRKILLGWYRSFVEKHRDRFHAKPATFAQEFGVFSRVCGLLEHFDEYRFDDENEENIKYNIDGRGEPMHPHKQSRLVEWSYIDNQVLAKVRPYFKSSISSYRSYINRQLISDSERKGMEIVANQVEYFFNNYPALAKSVPDNNCGLRDEIFNLLVKQQEKKEVELREAEFRRWLKKKYITFEVKSSKNISHEDESSEKKLLLEMLKKDFKIDESKHKGLREREFLS